MILRRRRKRAGLFLSLALVSKERKREREREREREFIILSSRGVFFCRFRNKGTQRMVFKSNSHRVFKNHTSLRFKYSSSSSGIWSSKNCLISQILLPFNSSKPLQSLLRLNRQVSRGARRSSSSASSFAERERERERENVVGKFVEEKRFTLNAAAAKTTKLELGNLSFCLLTHHHFINIISLKPKNVGGEDDERGSSSSTSSARTVSRVSANAFYGSEHDE